MGLDLLDLRDSVRTATGTDESDLPDEKLDIYLNMSWWELIDKFKFREKEVTVTFDTIIGIRLYNMPSPFEALRSLSIKTSDTNEHRTLKRITIQVYEDKHDEDEDARGMPVEYVREGCAARLWPTPDAVYTITQKYWTTLADITEDEPNLVIPQSWHEVVLFGALWRTFILHLSDFVRGNKAKKHQVSLVNSAVPVEAKEEEDSPHAGVRVLFNDYDV